MHNPHIVDMGYVDAKLLVESQQNYHIDLVAQQEKILIGKPATSSSIGTNNWPPVRKATSAAVGLWALTTGQMRSSTLLSRVRQWYQK